MAQPGRELSPWFTRDFLSQRNNHGRKLPTEASTDGRRGQLLRLIPTPGGGDKTYVWGELSDGEHWIDCCFSQSAVERFENKGTRKLGSCSSGKTTLRLRRWRFTLASPPQPLRSPSKTRPPLPPYKSRRMCLEVEDFDFFADGDGQTILTMDGSRDVFAWRERAGEEVERWLLELEGEKREGRGSTGSRIRGKAVDNEVELARYTSTSSSTSKISVPTTNGARNPKSVAPSTSMTFIDWSKPPPRDYSKSGRWSHRPESEWTPYQKDIMAKRRAKAAKAVIANPPLPAIPPHPAAPPADLDVQSKVNKPEPYETASSSKTVPLQPSPSTARLPPLRSSSPTRPSSAAKSNLNTFSRRSITQPPHQAQGRPASSPAPLSSSPVRIPPSSPPLPPHALPLPTSKQNGVRRSHEVVPVDRSSPLLEEAWDTSDVEQGSGEEQEEGEERDGGAEEPEDEDELEALRAAQEPDIRSSSPSGDDEDARVAAFLTQPTQASHFSQFTSSSYAASNAYSRHSLDDAPSSSPVKSSPVRAKVPSRSTAASTLLKQAHRPRTSLPSPNARPSISPKKYDLAPTPFPFPISTQLPPSPAASLTSFSPVPDVLGPTSTARRRVPRASLQALAAGRGRSVESKPAATSPAPALKAPAQTAMEVDDAVEVEMAVEVDPPSPPPAPPQMSEKAKGKRRAADQDALACPKPVEGPSATLPSPASAHKVKRTKLDDRKKRRFSLLDLPSSSSTSDLSLSPRAQQRRRRRTTLGLSLPSSALDSVDGSVKTFERLREEARQREKVWEEERTERGRWGWECAEEEMAKRGKEDNQE